MTTVISTTPLDIDATAQSIRKRLEETGTSGTSSGTPGTGSGTHSSATNIVIRTSDVPMDKDLGKFDEKSMADLISKLATLDIRMTKTPTTIEIAWSEEDEVEGEGEGEERFEVPEEEEADEEATHRAPQPGRGGRGPSGGVRGGRRGAGARGGRPRPRPEPLKTIDVNQIHGYSEVLQNITIQRLAYENWTRKKLVLVGANQPVERALSRINTHNILSLPVVDDSNANGSVIGLLDVLDIISALSETWETTGRPQRREILFTPISEIMSKKKNQATFLVSITTSLSEVIKQFSQTGISRAMIVDRTLEKNFCPQEKPEEMVVGMLTESDLVRFMAENFMWLKREKIFQQTLKELNIGNRKPITVDQNIQAFQAFLEIHKNGGEGAAMVDSSGKLIANVSASNIKGMTRRNFQLLSRPLIHFLSRDRKRGWWHLPLCTTLDTTLETVVLQFVATKIHRMYIVDNEVKPIGEIGLSDVIKIIASL